MARPRPRPLLRSRAGCRADGTRSKIACEFLFGNADPGVPDLDAQLVAAPPAAEQDLALIGVFHRVREQVADHLLEQARIAAHAEAARDDAPAEAMRRRVKAELRPQMLEQLH